MAAEDPGRVEDGHLSVVHIVSPYQEEVAERIVPVLVGFHVKHSISGMSVNYSGAAAKSQVGWYSEGSSVYVDSDLGMGVVKEGT